jgi:hypothetical protein
MKTQEEEMVDDDETYPRDTPQSEELKKEWEESEVCKRITATEMFAINHGFTEWYRPTVLDWWLEKLAKQQEEFMNKVIKHFETIENKRSISGGSIREFVLRELADIKSKLNI